MRQIDKQLSIWKKYAERLSLARATAPTKALQAQTETSLMVLSQEIYKLLGKRKELVMYMESTKIKASPSDAEVDIPAYPLDE